MNNRDPVHSDPSQPSTTTGPQTNAGETSDQGYPPLNGRSGVLFPYLPGGQGIGRLAPNPQPESIQQICKAATLSDGDITNSDGLLGRGAPAEAKDLRTFEALLNVPDVGSLYRFKRCLFSRSRGSRTHKVPALCLRRQGVQLPSAPVWTLDSTQGVHENSESDLSVPQDTGCRHAPESRRLAL